MERLARIVVRRRSLEELHELVAALRTLAASQARTAGEALAGTRRYRQTVARALAAAQGLAKGPATAEAPGQGGVLVVLGSEHGFVGGFNQRIVARAADLRGPGDRVVLVGQRAALRAEETRLVVDDLLPMTTHVPGIAGTAGRLAERLDGAGMARVVFAAPRPGGRSDVIVRPLLPPAVPAGAAAALPPLHHLPACELQERLAGEMLLAELAHALMESLASENGARLHAMEASGRNIGGRLDRLRQREAALRQEEVTADLLEVASGAAAVSDRVLPGSPGEAPGGRAGRRT